MMQRKVLIPVVASVILMTMSATGWACKMAGDHKHVGMVTKVDPVAGTFTIIDAETNKPIVFSADRKVLSNAEHAQGQVMVSYENRAKQLVAVDINY
ncbi:MAG: hypothetical protein P8079_01820 [Gammaproteobacteria bacterium]